MAATAYETHRGQAQVSRDGEVTLTRTFRLNTDAPSSRPAWGIAAIAINKYDSHPDDSTCLAVEVTSTPLETLGWFDVSYQYTNRPFDVGTSDGSGDPGQTDPAVQPNPTLRTPTVSWSSNSRMVPFTKDWSNPRKPVENSAKQPFEGLEIEKNTTVITVSFAKGLIDVSAKQASYINKVNDGLFKIIPAHGGYAQGTVKVNGWNGSYQFEAGYGWYTQCEVTFEYDPDGWALEVLDQGFYTRTHNGSEYVNQKIINTTTGMPIDAPAKLNGAGAKLPDGNPDVYLTFKRYEEVSFTNIFA